MLLPKRRLGGPVEGRAIADRRSGSPRCDAASSRGTGSGAGAPVSSPASAPFAHARAAFLWACQLDVAVRKPGNVSFASPGHGMEAQHFLASAAAAAPPLFAPGRPVGERIEAAIRATRAAAGCNTNLGIVLLCAPLALAAERAGAAERTCAGGNTRAADRAGAARRVGAAECTTICERTTASERATAAAPAVLRTALDTVLATLDIADARAAFRAIVLANPGGLGEADAQDVHHAPSVDLRAAMALAAERDRIARQYASGYADILDFAWPTLRHDLTARRLPPPRAVQALYVRLLARFPDSHLARKFGSVLAAAVSAEAEPWNNRLDADPDAAAGPAFADWDEFLKRRGLNPGTTADLTVATLFVAALFDPALLAPAAAEPSNPPSPTP
jgi:triphosphoribosyl-dephospho-CoA synthase